MKCILAVEGTKSYILDGEAGAYIRGHSYPTAHLALRSLVVVAVDTRSCHAQRAAKRWTVPGKTAGNSHGRSICKRNQKAPVRSTGLHTLLSFRVLQIDQF
jgi:hypothetical protein